MGPPKSPRFRDERGPKGIATITRISSDIVRSILTLFQRNGLYPQWREGLITLECGHCHGKLEFAKVPRFFTCRYCGCFTKESEVSVNVTVNTERRTQIQTVSVRVE